MTREERQQQRKLPELLLDTGEDYRREVEIDRELYQVIALDEPVRIFVCEAVSGVTRVRW